MDLVHMGAKYAPCMRNDSNINKAIELHKARERHTACCIRNDRGGCVQTIKDQCSQLLSHFHKWNASSSDSAVSVQRRGLKRNSGSVCGLDPECVSMYFFVALCFRPKYICNFRFFGIQGECIVTTLEHCQLMRGYFHPNAHLCAQVDCMQDVCGMLDFLDPQSPDQFYRLFTSIFIHAG